MVKHQLIGCLNTHTTSSMQGLDVFIFVRRIMGGNIHFRVEPDFIIVKYTLPHPTVSDMASLVGKLTSSARVVPPDEEQEDKVVEFAISFQGRGRLVGQTAQKVDIPGLSLVLLYVQLQGSGVEL